MVKHLQDSTPQQQYMEIIWGFFKADMFNLFIYTYVYKSIMCFLQNSPPLNYKAYCVPLLDISTI